MRTRQVTSILSIRAVRAVLVFQPSLRYCSTLMECCYLKGTLKFERIPDLTITDTLLKAIIVQALLDLHGEYGAAIVVEVLEYKELTKKSYSFIIKIPASNLVKVWSSLTLLGCYNGVATMFLIHQVSTSPDDLNDGNDQQLEWLFQ